MQQNIPPGNNPNFIRPAGVNVPGPGSMPGMAPGMNMRPGMGMPMNAGQPNMMGMVPQDPLTMFRQYMESGGGGMGGMGAATSIQWDKYGQGAGLDSGMQEIVNGSGPDQDSIQYLAAQVVQYNVIFMQQLMSRTGKFYELYRGTLDSFRRNEAGNMCAVRDAFVKVFSKHQEFVRPVAFGAAPLFGWRLINIKREQNLTDLSANHYYQAAEIAIRSVLFLEMVNWLMKSPDGQVHARSLPRDLAGKMPNLPNYIDAYGTACQTFGVNNNYQNLTWETPSAVRSDLYDLKFQGQAEYLYGNSGYMNNAEGSGDSTRELFDYVRRNARDHISEVTGMKQDQGVQSMFNDNVMVDRGIRTDFENLSSKNRREYQLHRYFHNIGKPNHYVIAESDWKVISKAFRKHKEMGQEETVLPGCFRIVIIDLEADTGWFSKVVRNEALDMPTVLTDPSKLLPELEMKEDSGMMVVKGYDLEDVTEKDKPTEIRLDAFNALKDNEIPVVAVTEEVISASHKDLETMLGIYTHKLVGKQPKANAVAFNATVWDTYTCKNETDRISLFRDMPFLFVDGDVEMPSLQVACGRLYRYFAERLVDPELAGFIDGQLTKAFNDFLVNQAGYPAFKHQKGFLDVDSLLKDYEDLDEALQKSDEMTWRLFNEKGNNAPMVQMLKMFIFDNPHAPEAVSEMDKLKVKLDLALIRPLAVTYINKRKGPLYTEPYAPIVMRRSIFPEIFQAIEVGAKKANPKADLESITKLLCFTDDPTNLWLVNYSAIDRNIATLRHIDTKHPLVLLSLN